MYSLSEQLFRGFGVGVVAWVVLVLFRLVILRWGSPFFGVMPLELLRRLSALFVVLGVPFMLAAWARGETPQAWGLTLGVLFLVAAYFISDRLAAKFLMSIFIRARERDGDSGAGAERAPESPSGESTPEEKAASGIFTYVLATKLRYRFPQRLICILNRREKQMFYSHEALASYQRKEVWKGLGASLLQMLLFGAGFGSVIGASLSILGRPGGVQQQLTWTAAFAVALLIAIIVFAMQRFRPLPGCFTCAGATTELRRIGTFNLRICSDDCRKRAVSFWRAMGEVHCQNLLDIDESDMRGALNTWEIDHRNFSRMLWEGARQLREKRFVLYRWTIPVEM